MQRSRSERAWKRALSALALFAFLFSSTFLRSEKKTREKTTREKKISRKNRSLSHFPSFLFAFVLPHNHLQMLSSTLRREAGKLSRGLRTSSLARGGGAREFVGRKEERREVFLIGGEEERRKKERAPFFRFLFDGPPSRALSFFSHGGREHDVLCTLACSDSTREPRRERRTDELLSSFFLRRRWWSSME